MHVLLCNIVNIALNILFLLLAGHKVGWSWYQWAHCFHHWRPYPKRSRLTDTHQTLLGYSNPTTNRLETIYSQITIELHHASIQSETKMCNRNRKSAYLTCLDMESFAWLPLQTAGFSRLMSMFPWRNWATQTERRPLKLIILGMPFPVAA